MRCRSVEINEAGSKGGKSVEAKESFVSSTVESKSFKEGRRGVFCVCEFIDKSKDREGRRGKRAGARGRVG